MPCRPAIHDRFGVGRSGALPSRPRTPRIGSICPAQNAFLAHPWPPAVASRVALVEKNRGPAGGSLWSLPVGTINLRGKKTLLSL